MPTIDASNMGINFNSLGLPNVVEICPSRTPTRTPTPTNTVTPTNSQTPTNTATPTVTPTNSQALTPTPTVTPSVTPEGVVDPPTVTQPPPIIPGVMVCDTTTITATTINGYAYYFDHQQTVNIPGVGSLLSPCAGGHYCNRTDFIPQLITSSTTINGSSISLNNADGGGDRSATFAFNLPDSSILSGTPVQIYLSCNGQYGCHDGVAWIVLTTTDNNGGTILLFNSCVVPNSLTPLTYTCGGINSANYNNAAVWDNLTGNVTTVGTNGGPSFYGTYDQSGNVSQWNDLDPIKNAGYGELRGVRGANWINDSVSVSSSFRDAFAPSYGAITFGFRLASFLNPLGLPNFVNIGDLGNVADTSLFGDVDYNYQIGSFLVTNSEYAEFLNTIAATDNYELYNINMSINIFGISSEYTYEVKTNYGDKPVVYVSWFDCARYCNWLHNGKGSGDTETGAYTLFGGQIYGVAPDKNIEANYHIPTENEWYKAAYYKGGGTNAGYWTYATQSDTAPIPVCATPEGDGTPC